MGWYLLQDRSRPEIADFYFIFVFLFPRDDSPAVGARDAGKNQFVSMEIFNRRTEAHFPFTVPRFAFLIRAAEFPIR